LHQAAAGGGVVIIITSVTLEQGEHPEADQAHQAGDQAQTTVSHAAAEVDHLIGDPGKAKRVLGWEPQVSFEQLVSMMVDADVARLSGQGRPASAHVVR